MEEALFILLRFRGLTHCQKQKRDFRDRTENWELLSFPFVFGYLPGKLNQKTVFIGSRGIPPYLLMPNLDKELQVLWGFLKCDFRSFSQLKNRSCTSSFFLSPTNLR